MKILKLKKIHQTQALTLNTFSHPLKKKRNLQQCVCSCVSFFCPYFSFWNKNFCCKNIFSGREISHQLERVSMMWKVVFAMCTSEIALRPISGWIYVRALTQLKDQHREPKQKAREKRNNTKCCVRFRWRLFEKHSAIYICDSEKTL